jgi:hypothetical protein
MTNLKNSLLTAAAALVTIGLLPTTPAFADTVSDEASFVAQINALRTTKGLSPLVIDSGLTAKARGWARTMAGQGRIWHSNLQDGITDPDWRKLGENVGTGPTVDGLHVAFINSPHHYDNLVDSAFNTIGLGVVRNASGTIFVAEEFMQAAPPAAPVIRSVPPKHESEPRPAPAVAKRKGASPASRPSAAPSRPRRCPAGMGRCQSATTRRRVGLARASL